MPLAVPCEPGPKSLSKVLRCRSSLSQGDTAADLAALAKGEEVILRLLQGLGHSEELCLAPVPEVPNPSPLGSNSPGLLVGSLVRGSPCRPMGPSSQSCFLRALEQVDVSSWDRPLLGSLFPRDPDMFCSQGDPSAFVENCIPEGLHKYHWARLIGNAVRVSLWGLGCAYINPPTRHQT